MAELAQIEVRRRGDAVIVSIRGEVDISNVEEVEKALAGAGEDGVRRFVIDLTETLYLDSVGIRLLFAFAEQLRARRQECYIIVPEDAPIRRVLMLVDLPQVVPLHATLDELMLGSA